jgi:hypothetical protein
MRATQIARRGFCAVLVSVAMLVGPGLVTLGDTAHAATVASTTLPAPTCTTANPAVIKKTLGIVVAAARRSATGKTSLCEYGNSHSSLAVVIQFNLAGSDSNYKTIRAGFDSNSEPTTSLKTLGSLANEAFTASLGTGSLAQHSVVALQKKLEVDIASYVPTAKLVVLMRQILTVS